MSPETVDAAVDCLLRDEAQEPVLSFYGGEPFLAEDLVVRAVKRARKSFGSRLRVNVPTNTLLVRDRTLDFARRERLDLTISIDGTTVPSERRDIQGRDVTPSILERVPALLALQPECRLLARMTVVPSNVARLSAHVRALYALGFRTIVYQPAYETNWTKECIDLYGREHERIGTWLVGLTSLGRPPPELEPWRSIARALSRGASRTHCGAGVDALAVAPDGAIFPCYRFATEPGGERYRLGDLCHGVTEQALRDEFAALDPRRLEPQDGSCAVCTARDGCGHFCPAGGALLGDGLRSVADVTCALIRVQVAAIRGHLGARPSRNKAFERARPLLALAAVSALGCTDGSNAIAQPPRSSQNPSVAAPAASVPNTAESDDSGAPDASIDSSGGSGSIGGGGVCAP